MFTQSSLSESFFTFTYFLMHSRFYKSWTKIHSTHENICCNVFMSCYYIYINLLSIPIKMKEERTSCDGYFASFVARIFAAMGTNCMYVNNNYNPSKCHPNPEHRPQADRFGVEWRLHCIELNLSIITNWYKPSGVIKVLYRVKTKPRVFHNYDNRGSLISTFWVTFLNCFL